MWRKKGRTMKTLSSTVGTRINQFDNLSTTTVETFNNLFPECPISGFDSSAPVEILDPTTNNCRMLNIAGLEVKHKMFSDLLYNVDKCEYNMDEESEDILGIPVCE